jgi:hypothetical protein
MKHQHEYYIEWIDEMLKELRKEPWVWAEQFCASLQANRDTLEKHKENPNNVLTQLYGDKEFYTEKHNACQTCRTVAFPCPSLLDVTKNLDEVMR